MTINYFQVNLGVLHKNEQYEEDMIDIVTYLHKYVPGHNKNCPESTPVKVLSGGDYLTFEGTRKLNQPCKMPGLHHQD